MESSLTSSIWKANDLFRPIFQLNMSIFNVRKFLRFKNAIQFSIDQAVWICTNDNGQISTSRIKLRNCLQKDQNKNFNWMSIESSFEIQVPILLMKLLTLPLNFTGSSDWFMHPLNEMSTHYEDHTYISINA